MLKAQVQDHVLELGDNANDMLFVTPLYVRDCYVQLANYIMRSKNRNFGVLGTQGIGKSQFAAYFLWRLWQQDSDIRVLYQLGETCLYFAPSGVVVEKNINKAHLRMKRDRDSKLTVWYLVDATEPDALTVARASHTLLLTSPKKDIYHGFSKIRSTELLYMPLVDWEEMNAMRKACHPNVKQSDALMRFERFGRSARCVLNCNWADQAERDLQVGIRHAVKSTAALDRMFGSVVETDANDYHSYMVVHIDVWPGKFTNIRPVFASKEIENIVLTRLAARSQKSVLQFLMDTVGISGGR